MAPAPKSRIQKGVVVEDPNEREHEPLIDIGEDEQQNGTGIPKHLTSEDRRITSPLVQQLSSSPKTTFIKRTSTAADGNTITIRGNATDMREHLKHLGPSNLASRPKTTRYNKVKIKPGHPAYMPGRSISEMGSIGRPESFIKAYESERGIQGGEGEGLLQDAGKDASDGVQALHQGYGSIERRFSRSSNPSGFDGASQDRPALKGDGEQKSGESLRIPRLNISRSNESSDTLGSLETRGSSPTRRKRRAARSGSITENIIEAGGVRKVVLEAGGSSDEDDNATSSHHGKHSKKNSSLSLTGLDENASAEEKGSTVGEDVKKKSKRRKKRNGKKGGEGGEGSAGPSAN